MRRSEPPLDRETLMELRGLLANKDPCSVSDASVDGDKKAVAVWFGEYGGRGKIVTKIVEGLPHDSGRGELAGPLLVLQVLQWIMDETGVSMRLRMWTDNIEVVQGCKKEGMSLLPSKATGRNVDMWMQIRKLRRMYAGEL